MGGEQGIIDGVIRSDGTDCLTLNAYFFAEYGANATVFGQSFSKSNRFIDYNNSPVKLWLHWENGKLVDHCTYGEDNSLFTQRKPKITAASNSYVGYSQYGTLFDGEITLINSAVSDSVTGYQTWTDFTTLDSNMTVNGDLYIKSGGINLNGYTLTVTGNIYQSGGYIYTNGGDLNVGGNYEIISNGTLAMSNDGEVNVSNDFVMKSSIKCNNSNYQSYFKYEYNQMMSGTLSIGGGFYQYIVGTVTDNFISDSNHSVKFVGNTTHEVYFDSSNSYFYNVEVENNEKLDFTGFLHGFPLSEDIIAAGNVNLTSGTLTLAGHKFTVEGDSTQDGGNVDTYNSSLVVNGDYKLTSGTISNTGEKDSEFVVDGQLVMANGAISLNRLTAAVRANLTQTGGYIYTNGGNLNVGGNYEISLNGTLAMNNNGEVNVSKDFVMKSSIKCNNSNYQSYFKYEYNQMMSGTLSIGGGFYQYIVGTVTDNFISDSNHTVKFVGNKTHEVYFESIDSYFYNVIVEDNGKLNTKGSFKGFAFLPCWKTADLCEDDKLDVFDLCLLKRKLING